MSDSQVTASKFCGEELFFDNNSPKDFSVLDFWRFGFSNLNSNDIRGILAEYLVHCSLFQVSQIGIRDSWADSDVISPSGTPIEVKCTAYLQTWPQKKPSVLRFSNLRGQRQNIGSSPKSEYKSDVYVFAVIKTLDPARLNLLDIDQWEFYVLSRLELSRAAKDGDSIGLNSLLNKGYSSVHFNQLKEAIEEAKGQDRAG